MFFLIWLNQCRYIFLFSHNDYILSMVLICRVCLYGFHISNIVILQHYCDSLSHFRWNTTYFMSVTILNKKHFYYCRRYKTRMDFVNCFDTTSSTLILFKTDILLIHQMKLRDHIFVTFN